MEDKAEQLSHLSSFMNDYEEVRCFPLVRKIHNVAELMVGRFHKMGKPAYSGFCEYAFLSQVLFLGKNGYRLFCF